MFFGGLRLASDFLGIYKIGISKNKALVDLLHLGSRVTLVFLLVNYYGDKI